MLLRTIADTLRRQDWYTLFIELLVLVIGLFGAFEVDRWWEARGLRQQEIEYVRRLEQELVQDIADLERAGALSELRQEFAQFLHEVTEDPDRARAKPALFVAAVAQSSFTYFPALSRHTFDDLRSTGNLGLVGDADLRTMLYDYYEQDLDTRQFTNKEFMIAFRFVTLTSGILDYSLHQQVQGPYYVVRPDDIDQLATLDLDPAKVELAIERFLAADEAIDWLPNIWGLQQNQVRVIRRQADAARTLLSAIRSRAEAIQGEDTG